MVDWRAPRKHVVMVLQGERSHLKTRPSASHTITIMKSSLNIDIVIFEGWGQETIRVTDVALHNNCILGFPGQPPSSLNRPLYAFHYNNSIKSENRVDIRDRQPWNSIPTNF
jgi:hypothetical protein